MGQGAERLMLGDEWIGRDVLKIVPSKALDAS